MILRLYFRTVSRPDSTLKSTRLTIHGRKKRRARAVTGRDSPFRQLNCAATIGGMGIEQTIIGGATAALCLLGFWKVEWLLEHSRNGRRLAARFGDLGATRILKLLLLAGAVFGTLLAAGIINPIRWSSPPAAVEPS